MRGFLRAHRLETAFLGFALFTGVFACLAVFAYYHPIPFQDHWCSLRFFDEYMQGGLSLPSLWAQHNEHRIVFPGLLFLSDYLLAGGTGYWLLTLIFILQGCHAALLGWAVPRRAGLPVADRAVIGSLALAFSFWLVQSENLASPHQISFLMGGFFASLAAFLISGAENGMDGKRGYALVLSAALCCLISTYSLANGSLMWGILPCIAWKSGLRGKPLLLWVLLGVLVMASYLIGYDSPPEQSSPWEAWQGRTGHYLLAFLGNPLTPRSIPAGTALGAAGMALLLWLGWKYAREEAPGFLKNFGMALALYSLGTALLTAVGRQQFGVLHSTCSRYQTSALLFWFSLLLLVYAYYGARPLVPRWIRIGTAILFFGVIFPTQLSAVKHLKSQYLQNDEAALGLMSGVLDTATSRFLLPDDSLLPARMEFMRKHRLSVYREAWPHILGARLPEQARNAGELQAEIEEFRPSSSRDGFFVRGKLSLSEDGRLPEVLLAVKSDTVIGFLKTGRRNCPGCFSGYVKGSANRKFALFGWE